jgi:hypothetical protein
MALYSYSKANYFTLGGNDIKKFEKVGKMVAMNVFNKEVN